VRQLFQGHLPKKKEILTGPNTKVVTRTGTGGIVPNRENSAVGAPLQ